MQPIYIALTEALTDIEFYGSVETVTEPFWVKYPNKKCTMKHNNKKNQKPRKEKVEKRKQKNDARKKNRA